MDWGGTNNTPVCDQSAFFVPEILSSGGRSAEQKEADHSFNSFRSAGKRLKHEREDLQEPVSLEFVVQHLWS